MKSRIWSVILLVSSAACAPSAPHTAPAPRRPDADVPPILSLLSERERLSLTSSQVIALDSVAREWDAANSRLTRRHRSSRGIVPIPVAALRSDATSPRAAFAENNRRAAAAVEHILTPAQRGAVCEARRPGTRRAWPWCADATRGQSLAARQ